MILDNKREKIINNHKNVFRTYKELKKLLPIGYIKTRVSKGQRYSIQKQSILTKLEKDKNKQINSPSKITKNLFSNKNIYLYSGENEDTKKILSKIKYFYPSNKSSKIYSSNNDSEIISKTVKNINTSKNSNNGNIIHTKLKLTNLNDLNSKKDSGINTERINTRGYFRSTTVNNYIMKNNIFLPSLSNRIKNNLPRYIRQNEGFLIEGYGKYSFRKLNKDSKSVNEYTNIDEHLLPNYKNIYETVKLLKNNQNNNYNGNLRSISTDNDKINLIMLNDNKKKYKNFLFKNLKDEELRIIGIKKKK